MRSVRAQAALASLGKPGGRPVTVGIMECNAVGAFSWPSGRIYVTRGLIDLLDDHELAAAMAHEMGHLLNDGKLTGVVSLRGCSSGQEAEIRADATGVRLLGQSGIPADAMVSLLRKVQSSSSLNQSCKIAMESRIQLLLGK